MTIVYINIPYPMLLDRIHFVIENRIHPEIFFSGQDLDAYQKKDVSHLDDVLRRNKLDMTLHGPFMDLSPGGVDRKIKEVTLDRFRRVMELAELLQPKMIVFHPGYERWKFDGNVNLWLDSSLQTWIPLVERAEKERLFIAIENVFEENPGPLAMLLEEINSPHFRFCFDTGHHHVFSKTPLSIWVEVLGKYLSEVHLHDNHKERDEHLPPGDGSFNFEQFFSLLSQFKLNPIYTLEPHEEAHLWRGLEAVKKYTNRNKLLE